MGGFGMMYPADILIIRKPFQPWTSAQFFSGFLINPNIVEKRTLIDKFENVVTIFRLPPVNIFVRYGITVGVGKIRAAMTASLTVEFFHFGFHPNPFFTAFHIDACI